MDVVLFLLPFVFLGVAVLVVAFSGGFGRAREAYLTRGNRLLAVAVPLIYAGIGIGVPAAIIAARDESLGAGRLAASQADGQLARGKQLFGQTCASCHTLGAFNARGVQGPNLDELGEVTEDRVLSAIDIGGTGKGLMPAELLEGENAEAVAAYVSRVAGKSE